MSDRLLGPIVFFSGMASLGVELAASRLLAPFFGTSLLVWANLIGLILIYLTVGYYLGGRWADRDPRFDTLYRIVGVGGFTVGLVPFVAEPLLTLAIPALQTFDAGLGATSFIGTLVLFSVPVTLLGCVTPFALRLNARRLEAVGSTAGNLYALSTLGSIFGVYLTTFVLIPNIGTRLTFALLSLVLLALAGAAIVQRSGFVRALPYAGMCVVVALLAAWQGTSVVKAAPNLIYEAESPYNFVQVVQDEGSLLLTVNEGQAYQSVYHPNTVLLGGYWDLMLLAPFYTSPSPPRSLLVIGLAAGTVPKQYSQVYPGIKMDGVEIDPTIVEVGRKYFHMNEPNLRAFVDDGRAFLRRPDAGSYDVIAVDAYHQPYIPFHLATVEFFRELKAHLSSRGVVAVNAAGVPNDQRLADALAATLGQVYPSVILIDHPNGSNTVLFASAQPVELADFRARLAALTDPNLRYAAGIAVQHMRPPSANGEVFTDDHAPVENLIHSIMFDYALGGK
ncbi:MAG: spermidine synthase [Rudaea sp.]